MNQLPFGEVRAWMFEGALPFWAASGVDPSHGGFLEELGFDGEPTDCSFKRVRVICRQIYVFSHALVLGWAPGAELSRLGFDYLLDKARLPDGGWARVLSRAGDVIDPTPDLYDLSFVLFAMAWRYRASGDEAALRCAHETLDYMHARMRAPGGEGFYPKWPPTGVRLQNPHMHFAEASIAAFEATADERFLDQAGELIGLFRRRLFDGRTLGERFTEDWRRLPGEEGRTLEPGHHFEWAWILAQYQRLKGADLSAEAYALASFAERFGVDAGSGAVFDAVGDDGAPLKTTSRAWTNTERIKAWLALFELTGRDPRREVAGSLRLLFGRYFAGLPLGLWLDQFDAEGRALSKAAPASIVYHLFLAFSEVLRLQPQLIALDQSPA
jgi:mannose/cellobiose epimerase-like protein (N-acyl-D-glucosamine 2-epimerase family)